MPKTTTSPKQAAAPQWAQELGLTDKQAMFVDEYIVDFSGAAAAIRAGYSKKGAGQQANALLKNPKVQQGIKLRTQDRIQRVELDQDFALERLRDELTARLSELYDENGALLQVHEWPDIWQTGLVAEVDTREERDEDGTVVALGRKVKIGDRFKRLEMLFRHLGLLKDKVELDASAELLAAAKAVTQGTPGVRPGGLNLPDDD